MKKGWEVKKLGEIILENKKSTLISKGNEVGEYPFFISGIKVKTYNKSIIDGQNIYLPTGGNFYVHFYEGKASYSTDTWSLRTIENTDIKYFYFFLLLKRDLINEKHFKGATIKHLQKSDFREIRIHLPPLQEQKQIVSILDSAFSAIAKAKANAEQNLKNAKELFESYLQGVFENKGDGWEEKKLGEVCSLITDGKHGDCENEENSGYYFLSAKDVRNGTLLFDNARQITKSGFEETHRRTNLKPGDICMVNTGATIGRISYAPDDARTYKSTFQKSVAVIKTIPNLIDNHFCCYILQSDLKKLVKVSSGTAVPNLLLGDLKRHKINLPKSLVEQQTIVQKLDLLSTETKKLESIYQKKIADLEELKKSDPVKALELSMKLMEYAMPKMRSIDVKGTMEVNAKIQSINLNIVDGTKHNHIKDI